MTSIKSAALGLVLLAGGLFARDASAHGFELQQDSFTAPMGFNLVSNQPVLDNTANPTPAPTGWNIFTDEFSPNPGGNAPGLPPTVDTLGNNPNNLASYGTDEGFVEQDGSGPGGAWQISSATFKILSPLYYSDGTGPAAQAATAGTYLQIFDVLTSDPAYIANPSLYPGTSPTPSNGGPYVNLTGTTPSANGFSVSALYFHELEKDLYIAPGSTQTFGEYGYAFDVTLTLVPPDYLPGASITTLTSPPMVDLFALTDSDLNPGMNTEDDPYAGDFGDEAPQSQQDAATTFIYDAAISAAAAVPEPSTFLLAALCLGVCGAIGVRRRRAGQLVAVPRSSSNNSASR